MKKNILLFYRDEVITFNLALGVILLTIMLLLYRFWQINLNITLIIFVIFIFFLNYRFNKISKKYIIQIPAERVWSMKAIYFTAKTKKFLF